MWLLTLSFGFREILTKIRDVENNNKTNGSSQDDNDDDVYHRDRFIAMERLKPVASYNYLISSNSQKSDPLRKTEVTSELGVYGVLVRLVQVNLPAPAVI